MSSSFHTSSKPLKEVDIRLPENTVKGAVKLDPNIGKYIEGDLGLKEEASVPFTYVTLDKQNEVLSDLITRLSVQLKLPQSGKNLYALRFEAGENDGAFLTNEHRNLIRQGFILILTASPEHYAISILSQLKKLRSGIRGSELSAVLADLTSNSAHAPFASEFHRVGGVDFLIEIFQSASLSDSVSIRSGVLQALLLLMEHPGLKQWSEVPDEFIVKISENITGKAKQEDNSLLLSSLNIVDMILNSRNEHKMALVMCEIPFESLLRHLEKSDERVLHSVLLLMNSLYAKASNEGKAAILGHLHSTPFRKAIENSVLRKARQLDVGVEQQLVVVQRILLNEVARRAQCVPSESDIEKLFLTKGFEQERAHHNHSSASSENRREEVLQFTASITRTPPGMLAIDLISSLALRHSESLAKIVMENSLRVNENEWSILVVSVELTLILVDILHVMGEPEEGDHLHVMLFKSDRPFEDLFVTFVRLFHRTWREMQACEVDVQKVLSVVRKQIKIGFSERPETVEKLEEIFAVHSYPHMQTLWEKERTEKEAEELQSESVKELRSYLRPSMDDLIKKNRKNVLKNGFTFRKMQKSKSLQKGQQFWFWKLDMTEKTLMYWDCTSPDNVLPVDASTSTKIPVSDIKKVNVGGDVGDSTLSLKGKKHAGVRGLALEVGDKPDAYFLATSDDQVINAWFDGISALIGSDKLSTQAQQHAELFLNIEVKMRLLELTHIPNSLTVPPLPENTDWIKDREVKSIV